MYKKFLMLILAFMISGMIFMSCSDDGGSGTDPDPNPTGINLVFPDGGDSLQRGASYEITWTDDIEEDVNIEIYKGLVPVLLEKFENETSDGSFQFTVPTDADIAADYKVKVVSATDTTLFDISEDYFRVIEYVGDGNDVPGGATVLTIPHLGDYAIYASGDVDYYRVYLNAGQRYYFANSSEDGFDSEFYLYKGNADGTDIVA
ncbi:MAG: hypothetical protein KAS62_04905, partial [Candidatus Delongbacteria bacterium]|nr:hypothetical protein [Candidatus Delongbacteria bacterium]